MNDRVIAKRYLSIMDSARARGIAFDLSFGELKRILQRKYCPYTGVLMTNNGSDTDITVDRVDNSRGYTFKNCIACTRMMNSRKGSLSVEEIERMHKLIQERK